MTVLFLLQDFAGLKVINHLAMLSEAGLVITLVLVPMLLPVGLLLYWVCPVSVT